MLGFCVPVLVFTYLCEYHGLVSLIVWKILKRKIFLSKETKKKKKGKTELIHHT